MQLFKAPDIDKADLKTNMVLEAAHFRSKRGWFATDIASRVARTKSECEFWVVAGETEAAKNVASLAQKLLSCSSSMGDVERCHKVTARTRTKVSNRKLASTTEAYCKIAVSESNKRYQGQKKPNAMQAFRRHLSKVMKIREERESTAQSIAEARSSTGSTAFEDDFNDVHEGLDELLEEVCLEVGCTFDSSDDEF